MYSSGLPFRVACRTEYDCPYFKTGASVLGAPDKALKSRVFQQSWCSSARRARGQGMCAILPICSYVQVRTSAAAVAPQLLPEVRRLSPVVFRFGGKRDSVPPKRLQLHRDFPTTDVNDALLHLLRLLVRLAHLQGTGDALRVEATRIRSDINRCVIPEDYEALALQIKALELGPAVTDLEPHHPGRVLGELIDAILPVARALRGDGPTLALQRLRNEADNPRAELKRELHAQLERLAEAVGFLRQVSEVFKLSILEIMHTLGRLSGDEGMSSQRLLRLKEDLERADDDRSLSALRSQLLKVADGLVTEAEARQARISRITEQVAEARTHMLALTTAITHSETLGHLDPLTGCGTGEALVLMTQHLAQSRAVSGVMLISVDGLTWSCTNDGTQEHELLLRSLTRLVRRELRGEQQAFHLGDGVVVVLLPKAGAAQLDALGERLCQRCARHPCLLGERERSFTASVGSVVWSGGQTFGEALKQAGQAQQAVRQSGGNGYRRHQG